MAIDYDRTAETTELGETIELGRRRRRQKGQAKQNRRRRYRKNRSKAKRRGKQYRTRNKSKIKRYEKRRRRNPSRHKMMKDAGLRAFSMDVPFVDLEHGVPGVIKSINPEEETLQGLLNGQPKEYDILDFLDQSTLTGEDEELFQALDETYEYQEGEEPVSDEEYDMNVYSYDRTKV